jgi:putative ABC transport system permease protein
VRDRVYATLALLSLGFRIAANTIIVSLVDAVLLRPLRYQEPGRLVAVNEVVSELAKTYPKLPVWARHDFEWRERTRSFAQLGIVEGHRAILSGAGDPERVECARVSASVLPLLGARLRLGRSFLEDEDRPGRDAVAILTEPFWTRRYAGNRGIVGRTITVNGTPRTVVGILEAGFRLPDSRPGQIVLVPRRAQIHTPITSRREALEWFGPSNDRVVGRLRQGRKIAQATSELNVLQADIAIRIPDQMHLSAIVTLLQDEVTERRKSRS